MLNNVCAVKRKKKTAVRMTRTGNLEMLKMLFTAVKYRIHFIDALSFDQSVQETCSYEEALLLPRNLKLSNMYSRTLENLLKK